MPKRKNVLMFGNKAEMDLTNTLLEVGIGSIIIGVTTLIIGGRRFYNTIRAISS